MSADQRLAQLYNKIQAAGIDALVMGGHAVRYYGIDRNTTDFDLVTSLETPTELRERLLEIESFAHLQQATVWRNRDFARFDIGRLPDGREEPRAD